MTRARKVDHRTRVGKERSARTETRILGAALGVFAARGPDAPVIDEFVRAAGIARGTFYNYFDSVESLLVATSKWTTREIVQAIEGAIRDLDGPTLRFGVGLRLLFARAQRDPVWSRFVAQVWHLGGLEVPLRDVDEGIKRGHFTVPAREAALYFVFGGIREALRRIGAGVTSPRFGDEVAATCLQALGATAARVAAVLAHPLPDLPEQRPTAPTSRGR
jgi:AcrR family transcriptional regulator